MIIYKYIYHQSPPIQSRKLLIVDTILHGSVASQVDEVQQKMESVVVRLMLHRS